MQQETRVQQEIIEWFAENGRDLPWREPGTPPWAILVCEVMSQQTPVARVLPAWREWMARWPEPADLAAASPADVLVAWGNLGYPRRALRLRECAAEITRHFDGRVPRSREDLLSLPGVGPYTADAIIAFAYRKRSVVLDTNIRRVLARQRGVEFPPPSPRKSEVAAAAELVPEDDETAAQYNAGIMELGALICTASAPKCDECPIAESCAWLASGRPHNAPPRHVQGFAGTQREARGKIMAVLRARTEPINESALRERSGLPEIRFSPALATLLADGLATRTASGALTLPR